MDGTTHPVLRCADAVHSALDDAAGAAVEFMGTAEKRAALLRVAAAAARLEGLRLRLVAAAADVADEDGCRDAAAWLTAHTRTDRAGNARDQRLAAALDRRWPALARGLAEAAVNPDQARAIAHSLDALPAEAGPELRRRAEAHLVAEAAVFGPRELRVLGRRILDIVAPELGEETERRHLEDEERRARETTSLTTRRDGDGCTLIRIKVPDAAADRLLTYLDAHTSPRATTPGPDPAPGDTTADRPDPGPAQTGPADPGPGPADPGPGPAPADPGPGPAAGPEPVPHHRRLGQAFCALLEAVDPHRLPHHGGDATTVLVTIDLAALRDGLGAAALGSHTHITAAEARRLACTAKIIPAVLGGHSEVLDLGRAARLFTPAQRKAMTLRDRTCRDQGCDIPAPWCEAHHHARPRAAGGTTDLADGALLCNWHHHRAHDPHYHHTTLPNGDIRFHRRR